MDPDAIIERLAPADDRRAAMEALAAEAGAADLAAARDRTPDPFLRELLTAVLGEQADGGDADAFAALVTALEDEAANVRGTAADQLGGALLAAEREGRRIGDEDLGLRLVMAFDAEPDAGARQALAVALGALAHEPARLPIRAAFAAEPGQAYGWALERLGDPPGDRPYGGTWRGTYDDLAQELLTLLAVDSRDAVLWDFPEEVHRRALAHATDPAVRAALEAALDDD